MRPFLPKRYEPIAFGFLLSGFMSLMVSGLSAWSALGLGPGLFGAWMAAWVKSWAFAFPAVLVVAPLVRRILRQIVKEV